MAHDSNTEHGKRLFVDNDLIADMSGLRKVFHSPTKHSGNPVLGEDHRWEHGTIYPHSMLYDDRQQGFHAWYRAVDEPNGTSEVQEHACYAWSSDGIAWEKPALGLIDYRGSTQNNIIGTSTPLAVMFNNDPELTPRRFLGFWSGKGAFSLVFRSSDDGIHWEDLPIPETGDLRQNAAETPPDPLARYYTTGQCWAGTNAWGAGRRGVMRCETADLVHWGARRVACARESDDPENLEFYTMDTATRHIDEIYGGLHFGFLSSFHTDLEGRRNPINSAAMSGTIDVALVLSRDSVDWWRPNGLEPFLPLGSEGEFDSGMIFLSSMIEHESRLFFHYGGWDIEHGQLMDSPEKLGRCDIGLAHLRLDGFASIESSDARGTLITHPFVVSGEMLDVNVDSSNGAMTVEIGDEAGIALPERTEEDCDVIRTDSLRHRVTWNGKSAFADLVGRTLRLKFGLAGATKLYSFTVTSNP